MVKPLAVPPLKASAHLLNWMSHALCTAATLLTNVLPLTSNGRDESPELMIAGAVIPPRAEALDAALVVVLARGAELGLLAATVELLA